MNALTLTFIGWIFFSTFTFSQIPSGYYNNASGKYGAELKTALHSIIKNGHLQNTYNSLYTHFKSTDKKDNGDIWDMYSDCPWDWDNDKCSTYNSECDCYNREHSFPASWFNDGYPMYADLFHLYPTDGYVNNRRGNYPFGEVGSASYTSFNGSKVGSSSYPGYSGTVFEPIDEYKGDFARTYFYMVTRYQDKLASWENYNTSVDAVLDGTTFPAFESWAVNMLIEWHNNDSVSKKEIDRNNAVYTIQKNRNPFIDHPEYVDYIWLGIPSPDNVCVFIGNEEIRCWFSAIDSKIMCENKLKKMEVIVYAVSGTICLTGHIENGSMAVEGLREGIYFVKILDDNYPVQVFKILINP